MTPGEHVVIVGGPSDALQARSEGLQLRDTLAILLPRGRVLTAFLFRQPLEGTVVENVLKHGVGGLWIDGCRISAGGEKYNRAPACSGFSGIGGYEPGNGRMANEGGKGRWPTNLLLVHGPGCVQVGERRVKGSGKESPAYQKLGREAATYAQDQWTRANCQRGTTSYVSGDGLETVAAWDCELRCPVRVLDEMSGERTSGGGDKSGIRAGNVAFGEMARGSPRVHEIDAGGASRFYPQFASLAEALDWLARLVGGP